VVEDGLFGEHFVHSSIIKELHELLNTHNIPLATQRLANNKKKLTVRVSVFLS